MVVYTRESPTFSVESYNWLYIYYHFDLQILLTQQIDLHFDLQFDLQIVLSINVFRETKFC